MSTTMYKQHLNLLRRTVAPLRYLDCTARIVARRFPLVTSGVNEELRECVRISSPRLGGLSWQTNTSAGTLISWRAQRAGHKGAH